METNQTVSITLDRLAKLAGMIDGHSIMLSAKIRDPNHHPIIEDVLKEVEEMSTWLHAQWNKLEGFE